MARNIERPGGYTPQMRRGDLVAITRLLNGASVLIEGRLSTATEDNHLRFLNDLDRHVQSAMADVSLLIALHDEAQVRIEDPHQVPAAALRMLEARARPLCNHPRLVPRDPCAACADATVEP